MAPRKTINYGWMVVAATFVTLFMTQGSRISYGLFLDPLIAEFHWSRATVSLPPAISLLVYGLTLPFIGTLTDKYGARNILAIGILLSAVGTLALAFSSQIWQFVLFFGIIAAFGCGAGSTVPTSVAVARWFDEKRRGLALGISSAGIAVGQFTIAPLVTYIILTSNWQNAFVALGLIMLVINLPMLWVILKSEKAEGDKLADNSPLPESKYSSWNLIKGAFQTKSLQLLVAGYFVCGFSDFFIYGHLPIYGLDLGFSQMNSAAAMSLVAIASIIGSVLIGGLSDKWGRCKLLGLSYLVRAVSFAALAAGFQSIWLFYIISAVAGLTLLATIPLASAITRTLFGQFAMGTLFGVVSLSHQLGAAIGTYYGGVIFDLLGSYTWAFLLGTAMLAFAAVVSFAIEEREYIWVGGQQRFQMKAMQ